MGMYVCTGGTATCATEEDLVVDQEFSNPNYAVAEE